MWIGAAIGSVLERRTVLWRVMMAGLIQLFGIQLWFQFPERHGYFLVPILLLMTVEVGGRGYVWFVELRAREAEQRQHA